MFKLVLKFQDTLLEEFTFDTTPVLIGRRDDNDIIIDNMAVSGHHARIEHEDPDGYVVVDLGSLNGTFINEKKIVKKNKIVHGDLIIIGKHTIEFTDVAAKQESPQPEGEKNGPAFRDTLMLDTEAQAELLAKQEAEIPGEQPVERPKKLRFHGSVAIVSGGTPEIIEVNKSMVYLGSGDDVDIKCSGLLVGKHAAVINRRPNGFYLTYSGEGYKKPELNGEAVTKPTRLKDGDEIVLGKTKMKFSLEEEIL